MLVRLHLGGLFPVGLPSIITPEEPQTRCSPAKGDSDPWGLEPVLRELSLFSLQKMRPRQGSNWSVQYLKEGRREDRYFLLGHRRTRDDGQELRQGKLLLDKRKFCSSSPRVAQHWHRCPERLGNPHPWGCSVMTWTRP